MRVLVCSSERAGVLAPLIGLALQLRDRGHDIEFLTHSSAMRRVEEVGLHATAPGYEGGETFRFSAFGEPAQVERELIRLRQVVKRYRPDVVLTHMFCMAPLLHRIQAGQPTAVMGFASFLWNEVVNTPDAPPGSTVLDRTLKLCDRLHRAVDPKEANAWIRKRQADARGELVASGLLGDRFMVRSVEPWESGSTLPANVSLVGPCLWEPEYDRDAAWQSLGARFGSDETPILYIDLGPRLSTSFIWPGVLEAVADLGVRAVTATLPEQHHGALPRNLVLANRGYQRFILERSAAAVSLARTTPVLGAITSGVPILALPLDGETSVNAKRIVATDCGMSVDRHEVSEASIGAALTDLMMPGAHLGRFLVKQAFCAVDGFEIAITAAESVGANTSSALNGRSAVLNPPMRASGCCVVTPQE